MNVCLTLSHYESNHIMVLGKLKCMTEMENKEYAGASTRYY